MEQICFDGFEREKSTDWKWTMANDYPKEKNGIKVFSCFACGGGSTMGYKLAGCDVLGCCEIDPKMNEVYVKNHHPKFNYLMDIRKFNELKELPEELYNLDILDGSPPCTTFSMAGLREETWGKMKKFKEGQAEQILDDLSFVFIETARKLKPKVVVMENVEGLLLGEAWSYVQRIYKEFDEAGYKLNHYLLKGELMGIPQTRHRVIFIAVRKDIPFDFQKLNLWFNYEPITYGEIKEGKGNKVKKNSQTYWALENAIYEDKAVGDVLKRLGQKERCYNDRLCWDQDILPTIPAKLNHMRPVEKEKISKLDIIHGQTFPEDYDFDGKSTAFICGMSVPPVMMKRVIMRLIETGVFD